MEKYTAIKKWCIAVHNNMDESLDIIMSGRSLTAHFIVPFSEGQE